MKVLKYIILVFSALVNVCAQDTINNFLPQSLGKNVNSTGHELSPVLSYDGKTLYFSREDSVPNKYWHERLQYIYVSKLQPDNTWGVAKKLPNNVNAGMFNAAVGISKMGDTLYINGIFTKKTNRWHKRGLSYVVKIDSNNWSNPRKIYVRGLPRVNRGQQSNMSVASNGGMLFVSMSKWSNGKKNNIYRCEKHKDFYWRPRKLKKPIKHSKSDEAPFLSPDGNTLYYATKRFDKDGKNLEIVKTTPTDETYLRWKEPTKLSDTINSAKWDSYYITNIKGSWAYFCSHNKSIGGSDIFRIKLFEENPFILIKGKILTKKNGVDVVPEAAAMKVYSNDKVVDTLTIDQQGNFNLLLPLGAKYVLRADAKNYASDGNAEVDALALREYKEASRTLYIKPSDALVTGKLLTTEGKVFDTSQEPKLFINGKDLTKETAKELGIDTFNVDFVTGKYMIKLPLHKKYDLEIKAKETNVVPATVDLSKVDEYKELSKDLFAAPIPKVVVTQKVAIFTGKVISKKTFKPITGNPDLKIQVDEADFYAAKIDTAKGSYEFELPLGTKHVINAKANGYYPEYEQIDLSKEKEKVRIIKDLYLTPIEKGQSIKLKNIFFDFGKSTLKKESFPELDKLYKFLTDNSEIKVEIAGHTDNKGAAEKNMQLSRWRARSVQQYLVQKGIDIKRVTFNGYGLSKPVADNKTEAGRALNRRVEFTILEH